MKKFENYLINNTSSFVCFLFAAITIFFLILLPCDYYNYNKVYNSNLSELNYIGSIKNFVVLYFCSFVGKITLFCG